MVDVAQNQKLGVVTKADVIAALGDTDPNKTNAGALRLLIGRGGNNTIQNYLNEIRASLVVPPPQPGAAPTAPTEAITSIWVAAWSAAQVHTLGRLEAVTAQREALQLKADTQASDIAALGDEVDSARIDVDAAKADVANAMLELERLKQECEHLTLEKDASVVSMATAAAQSAAISQAQVSNLESEVQRVKESAAAAQAIAQRDAKITAAAMQSTIDRLTDQVSELKSWIHRPAQPAPVAQA